MKPIRTIQKAYALTTAWKQIEPYDDMRVGVIAQNRSTNADSILIANGEPSDDMAGIELVPNGSLRDDILPMQGQIWAKAVTGALTLTLVLQYEK